MHLLGIGYGACPLSLAKSTVTVNFVSLKHKPPTMLSQHHVEKQAPYKELKLSTNYACKVTLSSSLHVLS